MTEPLKPLEKRMVGILASWGFGPDEVDVFVMVVRNNSEVLESIGRSGRQYRHDLCAWLETVQPMPWLDLMDSIGMLSSSPHPPRW